MADQANVYVKNLLSKSLEVIREHPNLSQDTFTLAPNTQETIFLASSDVQLFIKAPAGIEMGIPLEFKTSGGAYWSCSVAQRKWTIRTEVTDTNPDTPTNVNVNVGDEDV